MRLQEKSAQRSRGAGNDRPLQSGDVVAFVAFWGAPPQIERGGLPRLLSRCVRRCSFCGAFMPTPNPCPHALTLTPSHLHT